MRSHFYYYYCGCIRCRCHRLRGKCKRAWEALKRWWQKMLCLLGWHDRTVPLIRLERNCRRGYTIIGRSCCTCDRDIVKGVHAELGWWPRDYKIKERARRKKR